MSQSAYKPEEVGDTPMIPTCLTCGGRSVWISTSSVVWNKEEQRWIIDNLDCISCFCEDCDEIKGFVWVPMVGPTPGQRLIDVT